MKVQDIFDSYKDNIMPTYIKVPLIFSKGKGSYLWDIHGEKYLEYLKLTNPKVYYAIMKTHLTEEGAKEKAAEMLFLTGKYAGQPGARGHALEGTIETILPFDTSLGWGGVPYEERLAGVQRGLTIINNYDSSVHYYPSTGDRMIGPRADRTIP